MQPHRAVPGHQDDSRLGRLLKGLLDCLTLLLVLVSFTDLCCSIEGLNNPVFVLVLASLGAASSLLSAWHQFTEGPQACGWLFMLVRAYLHGPMTFYNKWWKEQTSSLSPDGKPVMLGVSLQRGIQYGRHPAEILDLLAPADVPATAAPEPPPTIYVHGGGFVCCSSEILTHSITPLVRAGVTVYSIDYPLAPEHPYPAALISVLRAVYYVWERHGKAGKVSLLGDSAGGNLVCMAAALLSNRALLTKHFPALVREHGPGPQIECVVSVYGVLDQVSWRATWTGHVMTACWACYLPPRGYTHQPKALLDLSTAELSDFPESLLICGSYDGLKSSSWAAHGHLTQAGRLCRIMEFKALHGFLGVPPQWSFGTWKVTTAPALMAIASCLTRTKIVPLYPLKDLSIDWSIFVVAGLHLPFVLGLCVVIYHLGTGF